MSANPASAVPAARRRGPAPWLVTVERAVDHVLEQIRTQPECARRSVTRELGLDPRPGMLRAIVRIASDPETKDPRSTLPRRLLALHVLVARELTDLLESRKLDGRQLRRNGRRLAVLRRAVRDFDDDLRQALAGGGADDRAFLVEVADAMALPESRWVAATILAPRLELLVVESQHVAPGGAGPALPPEDEQLLRYVENVHTDIPSGCRAAINAVALRTLIEEDLERLSALDGQTTRSAARSRAAVLDRLRNDIIAYRVIDERLREQQDVAIAAGLDVFADEIGRVKSDLFAAQLELSPVFRRRAAS